MPQTFVNRSTDARCRLILTRGSLSPWPQKMGIVLACWDIICGAVRSKQEGYHSIMLTLLNFLWSGNQALRVAMPQSFLSDVSPVRSDTAPPWLKPPSTIRPGLMPASTSADISSLICRDEFSIPASSSSVLKPKE